MNKRQTDFIWRFVEKHLPNYYHRDDVLLFDIYTRFLDGDEISDYDRHTILETYGNDKQQLLSEFVKMRNGCSGILQKIPGKSWFNLKYFVTSKSFNTFVEKWIIRKFRKYLIPT